MIRLAQSPTDPGFVQDPYPFYERARSAGPLFWWTDYGLPCTGDAALTGAVFRDRRFGREAPPGFGFAIPPHLAPFYAVEAHSMLELEPPRHTRLRGLVLRAFTSRRIAALAPEIAALCETLLDRAGGTFDLLDAYARPLPVRIIAGLLGVPEETAPDLLAWSNAMVAMYQAGRSPATEAAAVAATEAFVAFLTGYIETKRRRPADDLITHLIAAEEDGTRLSTPELISTCILLLNAGHEATVHTIGNGVKTLLDTGNRDLGTDRIEGTIEEILRHDPPLHMFTRWVNEDLELSGQRFRRGERIGLLLAMANRDPAVWPDPSRFDPARPIRGNFSFGAGIHFCVGAPLARLELQIALPALFARFPDLKLGKPPEYADAFHFHGLTRLMVTA
jgi:cytochrome P450